MGMNFPSSPSVGQVVTFDDTSYTWNGYGWLSGTSAGGTAYVKRAGDTMTGPLNLSGPTNDKTILMMDGKASVQHFWDTVTSYIALWDGRWAGDAGAGNDFGSIWVGGGADPANYYMNTTHYFCPMSAAAYTAIDATGVDIRQTTPSASPTTGALKVAGGAGIAGALNVGTTLNVSESISTPVGTNNMLGDLTASRSSSHGILYFGTAKGRYLYFDGAKFELTGGPLLMSHATPTDPAHAASKAYVDSKVATVDLSSKVSKSGDTMSGALLAAVKGHVFGVAAGTAANGAVAWNDAAIRLYDGGANNWAGMGCDGSGYMWFRTGLSGNPVPALYINTSQQAVFTAGATFQNGVTINASGLLVNAGGLNVTGAAAFQSGVTLNNLGLTISAGGLSVTGGTNFYSAFTGHGDCWINRGGASANQGLLHFGNTGVKYIYWDGTTFNFTGGGIATPSLSIGGAAAATQAYVNSGDAAKYNISGGTITGKTVQQGGVYTTMGYGGSGGALEIQSAGGASEAMISFHRTGAFACNFGLGTDGHMHYGGWSHGGVDYTLWGSAHCGYPMSSFRMAYLGDYGHSTAGYIEEPYGGGCVTGFNWGINQARYRQNQIYTNTWYAVGYA